MEEFEKNKELGEKGTQTQTSTPKKEAAELTLPEIETERMPKDKSKSNNA